MRVFNHRAGHQQQTLIAIGELVERLSCAIHLRLHKR
jgi:hypothetical protein